MEARLIKIEAEIVHAPPAPVPPLSPHLVAAPSHDSPDLAANGCDSPAPASPAQASPVRESSPVVPVEPSIKPPCRIKRRDDHHL